MMEFPVSFQVGPWSVPAHPVLESLAYFTGMQLFLFLRRRQGEVLERGQRPAVVLAAIFGAIVGAKLLALAVDPAWLWANRADARAWGSGKTIVGGLLGGHIAVELAKRGLGIGRSTGDLYAIPLALGIAVGRIGCFLTGLADRTYGSPTGLPWGIDFGDGIPRHPTQLYEMVVLAALAVALAWRMGRPYAQGHLFRLFMAAYLAWRLLVGFIQPDPTLLGLSAIQWACVAALAYYAPRLRSREANAAEVPS